MIGNIGTNTNGKSTDEITAENLKEMIRLIDEGNKNKADIFKSIAILAGQINREVLIADFVPKNRIIIGTGKTVKDHLFSKPTCEIDTIDEMALRDKVSYL